MDDPDVFGPFEPLYVMAPGPVTFSPPGPGQRDSFSFDFVTRRVPGLHGTRFRLQWRSTSGAPISFHKGVMHALWDARQDPCV